MDGVDTTPERIDHLICYAARANYCVIQTDAEGHSAVFSAGEYVDEVVFTDAKPRFRERLVVLDTSNIQGLLAVRISSEEII